MLLKAALPLLIVWLVGVIGLYELGQIVHAPARWLEAAAARRAQSPRRRDRCQPGSTSPRRQTLTDSFFTQWLRIHVPC
jgi:hypothetical protein